MSNTAANGHVVLFAYPKQGHMSPMLQFGKRLASKGIRITFLTTSSAAAAAATQSSLQINLPPSLPIHLRFISDLRTEPILSLSHEHESFQAVVSRSFGDFMDGALINWDCDPPSFVVFDSVMPWAMDVAGERGIDSAPFFTESCAVNHILNQVYEGSLRIPPMENAPAVVSIPPLPILHTQDLPYSIYEPEVVLQFMTAQFSSFNNAKWIFVNSFDHLEMKVVNWMAKKWPIKTVGPTIPSAYLDGRLKDDKSYGLINHQNHSNDKILHWLDSNQIANCSVIYISFGSLVILQQQQVNEVASFLQHSNFSFLWVLRESEFRKLPNTFLQHTNSHYNKGLVVNWCSQLQVLSHKAISCFVTHCGWNSTLEALSLGVPMVAVPQWVDQTTNAKFVADVWKLGVRVKMDANGIATKEELEASVRLVVGGNGENEFKQNSIKMRKLAKEAMDEGGSSDENIEQFVKAVALSI